MEILLVQCKNSCFKHTLGMTFRIHCNMQITVSCHTLPHMKMADQAEDQQVLTTVGIGGKGHVPLNWIDKATGNHTFPGTE